MCERKRSVYSDLINILKFIWAFCNKIRLEDWGRGILLTLSETSDKKFFINRPVQNLVCTQRVIYIHTLYVLRMILV